MKVVPPARSEPVQHRCDPHGRFENAASPSCSLEGWMRKRRCTSRYKIDRFALRGWDSRS